MIITAKANGDVLNIKPSVFYQGSTEANRIYLIAPFAINSSVSVGFTLPNTKNIPVTLMTPSTVISDTLNTWVYDVPATLTQYVGIVKVNISITTPSGNTITLNRCQFEVKRGDEVVLPEPPEADVYATIVQALADIYANFINKVDANYTDTENDIEQGVINNANGLKLVKTVGDVTVTAEVTENGLEINGVEISTNIESRIATHNESGTAHADIRLIAETAEDNSEEAVATANEAKETADNAESVALGIDAKAQTALENSEEAVETANEAKAIALGVEQAKVFDTFEEMETWLKDEVNKGLHTTGLELLIKDANVPDYWVSAVLETPNANGYYYDIEENEASVLSVNGKKGVVVLKTDDVSDAEQTNKWSTAEEKEKISKIVISGDGKKALLNDGTYGEVGTVDTVNGVLPDENKNITITADDISDTDTTNKFATAEELAQIGTNATNIAINTGDIEFDREFNAKLNNPANSAVLLKGKGPSIACNMSFEVFSGPGSLFNIYYEDGTSDIGESFYGGVFSKSHTFNDTNYYWAVIEKVDGDMLSFYENTYSPEDYSKVRISNLLTSINNSSFKGCINLDEIIIPNSITSIEHLTFSGCPISSIELPNTITTIGTNAFKDCTNLKHIELPSQLTEMNYTFYGCTDLSEIIIPESVTDLGDYSFYGCSKLNVIKFNSATVAPIGSNTFTNSGITTTTGAIYVPYASLTAYKTATNWSTYADRIFPIPEGEWITEEFNALETNKADKATTISGYGITDAYTKTEIESKIASVYKYKGSVANYASLPTADLEIGYVYNVEDTGDNYAWTGTAWDKLAGTIDLTNYATKLSIEQYHVPYRDASGTGEANTSRLATMTNPLPSAIIIRDNEGKATFTGGTSANQGIVKSQLDSAVANMVTTNTDQTIGGTKTFTSNIIGTLTGNSSSSTYCSRLRGVDTRADNETPEWYYTGGNKSLNRESFLCEFKRTSAIGLSGSTYCLLLTVVPWSDSTGGLPSQTAYLSNGTKYARYATSTTTWSAWEKEATTQSYTATLPSASWTGSSAPYSKEVTVSGILATDKLDIDLDLSSSTYSNVETIQTDWSKIYRAVSGTNKITFYASKVPTIDIPLQIKVVR